ncbi:hypothetical protein CBS101457_001437 [Exobasidium rhododendri]|nr:hypothetical protein CBS101457_001437 [Exobasidium rhododendri]
MASPARKDDSSSKESPADVIGEAGANQVGLGNAAVNGGAVATLPTVAMDASQTAAVLSYFKRRGFKRAEDSLKAEIEALANGATPSQARNSVGSRFGTPTVSIYDLATKSAPREPAPGGGSSANGNGSNGGGQSGIGPLEQAAVEALRLDPTDRIRGFRMLRNWCEGSLDIYQPELRPLLLPLFVHAYLDLTEMGYGAAAAALYTNNSLAFLPHHTILLSSIRSLSLPSHVTSDALSQRFRTERYIIKMSSTVFSLLLGWLTDGGGPIGGAGAGEGIKGEGKDDQDRRGREAMLKILNERCRIQVLNVKPQELTSAMLEEGTGLTGTGPSFSSRGSKSKQTSGLEAGVVSERDAVGDYNTSAAGPRLKLGGKIPLSEKLQAEVEKEAKAEEMREGGSSSLPIQTSEKKVLQPEYADLPPQAPVYRTVDIEREVGRLRDARKALRFDLSLNSNKVDAYSAAAGGAGGGGMSGPSFLSGVRDATINGLGEEGAKAARIAGLPSVCAYTYHDAVDGLTSSNFSQDLTLMAAGFEESYVQIWSLKGESLQGFNNDFTLSQIRDKQSLERHREKKKLSTRKLIGHGGPVYDVSFDPSGGSIAPPKHLLSASGDGTARLWSLETYTALVSYRGHQQPIWSVEWSPTGIYFATGSADGTARLWSTERINPLRMYSGHLSDVDCLNFHPNSLYLATGSSDKTCRLWDVQRGACARLFVGHQSAIGCVKISPDGRYLVSAGAGNAPSNTAAVGDDYAISLWDLGSGGRIKKMWGHKAPVLSMDFSTDGQLLVSSGADCQVICWDIRGAGGPRTTSMSTKNGGIVEPNGASSVSDGMIPLTSTATKPHASSLALSTNKASSTLQVSIDANSPSSADCISIYYTKKTPMLDIFFTPRNLCVAAGAYDASNCF